MNVIFDNIIFSLQRSGGVSKVWYELLKRAAIDTSFSKLYLEYSHQNIFRQHLELPIAETVYPSQRPFIERYLTPQIRTPFPTTIFHSSYFRILPQKGVQNITTIHDFTYNYFRSGLPKFVHLWQERYAINHSAGIICVSENTKKDLLAFYPHIDENKIAVVYNGVDECFRQLPNTEELKKFVPFESGSYVLYVGNRQVAYKNFAVAVNTAKNVVVLLVIVGTKLTEKEEQFLNATLGKHHFAVVPDASVKTLNLLYNGALCLLYPSLYEGFGIPVLEAQRAGCPVVCFNVASLPEVAGDGALIVEYKNSKRDADAIAEIVSDLKNGRVNIDDLRQRGKTNARRFSWDKTYQQTLEFYNKIKLI